jgi:2-hydroxychromene-2-carboxylate isomerase
MSRPRLAFWFEFASTYSYPAALRIESTAAAAGVGVDWKPFLLGPIFGAQGWNDSPFNIYPVKGRYMWRDLERLCAKHGIPFRRPTRFPRPSLPAARIACLAAGETWGPEFVRAVYRANFAEDRDIADPAVIGAILDGLGQPGAALVARTQAPEVKDALRRQTEEAQRLGIFGAPSFFVAGELFWGNDRLEDALAWARRENVSC